MINANELKIGNWFYIGDMIGQCNADSFKTPELFDPIPLTPDILEKCGFEILDSKVNAVLYFECSGKKYSMILSDSLRNGIYVYESGTLRVPIPHLHQLQNLYFALTSQELIYTP